MGILIWLMKYFVFKNLKKILEAISKATSPFDIFFVLFGPFYTNIQAIFWPMRPIFGSGVVISQEVIGLQALYKTP